MVQVTKLFEESTFFAVEPTVNVNNNLDREAPGEEVKVQGEERKDEASENLIVISCGFSCQCLLLAPPQSTCKNTVEQGPLRIKKTILSLLVQTISGHLAQKSDNCMHFW